jgi:CubicO group peptidase (beta-lactamase class C family)
MRNPLLKKLGYFLFGVLLLHLIIEVTGHHYLYQTLKMTVFKGRLGPSIQEYEELPKRVVEHGAGSAWYTASAYNAKELTPEALDFHQAQQSVSFLVIHRDSILYEHYWEGFDDASISNSFSMAKSVVSLLTGIAIDKGYIKSVDEPVYHYLPQYETELGKDLRIWHLLSMSSGINFDEHYLNPFAFPARANYGDDLEALLRNYEVAEAPGQVFNYQSGTTQVLGMLLTAATRKRLSELAQEWVWQPVGAQADAIWSLDHDGGVEKAFCCINARARDFARIGKLYLQYGRWDGVQIVDSTYIAESVQPAPLTNKEGEPCSTYGYSWWIGEHNGEYVFYMRGIKGQYVLVMPSKDLIVVRLGRKRYFGNTHPTPEDVHRYLDMGLSMIE